MCSSINSIKAKHFLINRASFNLYCVCRSYLFPYEQFHYQLHNISGFFSAIEKARFRLNTNRIDGSLHKNKLILLSEAWIHRSENDKSRQSIAIGYYWCANNVHVVNRSRLIENCPSKGSTYILFQASAVCLYGFTGDRQWYLVKTWILTKDCI